MKLRCLDGPNRGDLFTVTESGGEIGRSPDCVVTLSDDEASREHARITYDDYFRIQDLGSTNGVFVNGQKILGLQRLGEGDRVRIGITLMVVEDAKPPPVLARAAAVDAAEPLGDAPPGPRFLLQLLMNPLLWVAVILAGMIGGWMIFGDRMTGVQAPAPQVVVPEREVVDEISPFAPLIVDEERAAVEPEASQWPSDPVAEHLPDAEPGAPPEAATPTVAQPPQPRIAPWLWLDTVPSGARVSVNGENRGEAPVLLDGLAPGRYLVVFELPHFDRVERFFEVPTDGEQQQVTLRQQNGTCRVTSVPAGAGVWLGPRLLGVTPLMIADLAPGKHELRLALPGYRTASVDADIVATRPSQATATLVPEFGTLTVTTIPPGLVILVDDQVVGVTAAANETSAESLPLTLTGMTAGAREVRAREGDALTDMQRVVIESGKQTTLRIVRWRPTVRVQLTNGRSRYAMLLGETPLQYLLITFQEEIVRLDRDLVQAVELLSAEEQTEVLQRLQRDAN